MHSLLLSTLSVARNQLAHIRPSFRISPASLRTPRFVITVCRCLSTASPFIPSPEQKKVVDACKTHNVVVSAVPGSGKTSTIRAIAAGEPDCPTMVLTYSKRLQLATAETLEEKGHVDVSTFHRALGMLYPSVVSTDSILSELRSSKTRPNWTGPPVRRVIIDEAQDMTVDLYWATCTLLSAITEASGSPPRLVVLGDPRQMMYKFRGADARFLEQAPELFSPFSPYRWKLLSLGISHRLSHANADFVNDVFLGGERYIEGSHDGPRPLWIRAGLTIPGQVDQLCAILAPLIREHGPQNTAFLAPYIKDYDRIMPLVNQLCETHRIPFTHPIYTSIPFDREQSFRGKVALTTFHQFKGSERNLVILSGLDAHYFRNLGRDLRDDRLPPEWFVALTRARVQIVVLQWSKRALPRFTRLDVVSSRVVYSDISSQAETPSPPSRPPRFGLSLPGRITVGDLLRHLPSDVLDTAGRTCLKITKLKPPLAKSRHINPPTTVVTHAEEGRSEIVADINELVCKEYMEILADNDEYGREEELLMHWNPTIYFTYAGDHDRDDRESESSKPLAHKAVMMDAKTSGFRCRLVQMEGQPYDWLEPYVGQMIDRLKGDIPQAFKFQFNAPFGQSIVIEDTEPNGCEVSRHEVRLTGVADVVCGNVIWKVRLTSALTVDHAFETLLQGYLYALCSRKQALPGLRLFNVQTGELWKIEATMSAVAAVVETLLRASLAEPYEKR